MDTTAAFEFGDPGHDRDAVRRLGPEDAKDYIAFLLRLDERARNARFHRHMSPDMVRDHCATLDWNSVVVVAWHLESVIHGVCEAHVFPDRLAMGAEIALCVSNDWRDQGIEEILVADAMAAASGRGARMGLMLLHRDERGHANLMRRLGGTVDWERGIAILPYRHPDRDTAG